MKLYATIKNNRGGKKGSGDDTILKIELSYGNKVVGEVVLASIIDDKMEGYRVIFNDPEKGFRADNVIKEVESKKQQGEYSDLIESEEENWLNNRK